MVWQYSDGSPLNGAKIFNQYQGSMTAGALSVVNIFTHALKFITAEADDNHHTSVNLVYDSKGSTLFLSVDR